MVTQYPGAIDSYGNIRVVRDRIDELVARDHNDLRSSIIAIETTLGVAVNGAFGTVAERLRDGYENVVNHASGEAPRHNGTHIDQGSKTGTEFSFSAGTVDSQITETLDTFNELASTSGAGHLGLEGFTTTPHGIYTFDETKLQAHVEEAGTFLDKNASLLSKLFGSFVMSGMAVTVVDSASLIVNVALGYVSLVGREMYYGGSFNLTLLTTPGNGTYYVYAIKVGETVEIRGVVSSGLAAVLSLDAPIAILSEVVIDRPSYSNVAYDLRRFGNFTNDKMGFTVGKKPYSGGYGYGCDFLDIKSAVKFIGAMRDSGVVIGPSKITLVNDILITSTAAIGIDLLEGIEIDGAGNTITTSVTGYLFNINVNNVTIRNLNFNIPVVSGSNTSFAAVATLANVKNLKVLDCNVTSLDTGMYNFIKVSDSGGTYTMTESYIMNNSIMVKKAGVALGYTSNNVTINNCIIQGNYFYQSTFTSSYGVPCIFVGYNCNVLNNRIYGGYLVGIAVNSFGTIISGNHIMGAKASSVVMGTGIALIHSTADIIGEVIVANNVIKGILTTGIDCYYSLLGYVRNIYLKDNIISNEDSAITVVPTSMIAINGYYLAQIIAENNEIVYFGYVTGKGINNVKNIINNTIRCYDGDGSSKAISISNIGESIVNGNIIRGNTGYGIFVEGSRGVVINGNSIIEPKMWTDAYSAINLYESCEYAVISNNNIIGTIGDVVPSYAKAILVGNDCQSSRIIGNYIYNISSDGVYFGGYASYSEIKENYFFNIKNGIYFDTSLSTNMIISNNIFVDDHTSVSGFSEHGIYGVCSNSIIDGNSFYGFGKDETSYMVYFNPSGSLKSEINVVNNAFINVSGIAVECSNYTDINISNNVFKGNGTVTGGAILNIKSNSIVSNNVIFGYGAISTSSSYGIKISSGSAYIQISDNMFYGLCDNLEFVVYAGDAIDVHLTGNSFIEVIKGGIFASGSNWIISDNMFLGTSSATTGDHAIWLNYLNFAIISNNIIFGSNDRSFFADDSNNIIFTSNYVRGNQIYLHGKYITISNNRLYFEKDGIYVSYSHTLPTYNVITDNIIIMDSSAVIDYFCIKLEGSIVYNMIISNNLLYDINLSKKIAIENISYYSVVCGNYIRGFGKSNTSVIKVNGSIIGAYVCNNIFYDSCADKNYDIEIGISCLGIIVSNNVSLFFKRYSITMGGATNSICSHNYIMGANYALSLSAIQGIGAYSVCENNYIYNPNGHAIEASATSYFKIKNNYIYINTPSTNKYNIYLSSNCSYVHISGNICINGWGISTLCTNSQIIDNFIINTSQDGIFLSGSYNKIENNYITITTTSSTYAGIRISGSNIFVGNNYLITSSRYAIKSDSVSYLSVLNNFIRIPSGYSNSPLYSIYLTDLNNTVVSNNTIVVYGTNNTGNLITAGGVIASKSAKISNNYLIGEGVDSFDDGIFCNIGSSGSPGCVLINDNYIKGAYNFGINFSNSYCNCNIIGNFIQGVVGTSSIKTSSGIVTSWVYETTIENNYITKNNKYGICGGGALNNYSNNYINMYNLEADGYAIGFAGGSSSSSRTKIDNNIISFSSCIQGTAICIRHGVATPDPKHILINGNYINNAPLSAIVLEGHAHFAKISNNYINTTNGGIAAIYIKESNFVLTNNNYIYDCNGDAIFLSDSTNCSIFGNHIVQSYGSGISLLRTSKNSISNNYIYAAALNGIVCADSTTDCDNILISSNYFDSCVGETIYIAAGTGYNICNNYLYNCLDDGINMGFSLTGRIIFIMNNYISLSSDTNYAFYYFGGLDAKLKMMGNFAENTLLIKPVSNWTDCTSIDFPNDASENIVID